MLRSVGWKLACCATIGLVGAACEADDDAERSAVPTPDEVSTVVTDEQNDDESVGDAPAGNEPTDDESAASTPSTSAAAVPSSAATTTPDVSRDVLASPATTRPAPPVTAATETVYPVGSVDPGLAPFVSIATEDLAAHLEVEVGAIEVLTAVLVAWPDTAAGCPEPGRVYPQILTDGSVIELGIDELVYRYHSGGERAPFRCEQPLRPVPSPVAGSTDT